jgi:hypothetical protein
MLLVSVCALINKRSCPRASLLFVAELDDSNSDSSAIAAANRIHPRRVGQPPPPQVNLLPTAVAAEASGESSTQRLPTTLSGECKSDLFVARGTEEYKVCARKDDESITHP